MATKSKQTSGFALVISLSLLAFILLLVLSLTTFVRVESQTAQLQLQQVEAEQNALLGLQQAIGELQKMMGPDQRISATADVLPDTHPSRKQLTGVWLSDVSGTTLDGNSFAKGDLLKWLISDSLNENDHTVPAPSTAETMVLVGAGSLADANVDRRWRRVN